VWEDSAEPPSQLRSKGCGGGSEGETGKGPRDVPPFSGRGGGSGEEKGKEEAGWRDVIPVLCLRAQREGEAPHVSLNLAFCQPGQNPKEPLGDLCH